VHYYFETLDDLFIAAFHAPTDAHMQTLTEALQGDQPLRALWEYANDKRGTALTLEFLALANHRKAVRAEIAGVAERFRKVELEAVSRAFAEAAVDIDEFPPAAMLLIMTAIPMSVVLEEQLSMTFGHDEATRLVRALPRRAGTTQRPRRGWLRKRRSS
jgi:AcrR family transcriptional regulator